MGPVAAASVWIRKRRDNRVVMAREVVGGLLDSIGSEVVSKRIAVVVAHPDDEAIGAGAVLRGFRDVTIVHVTDGAPRDDGYAGSKGFASRAEYAAARR